jgi:hypothetical protein
LQAADIEHCTLDDLCRIYGSMKHPVLGVMPFTSVVVREEYENCEDWLSACVPLGGLSSKDSRVGGWPFGNLDHAEQWRAPLESSLADLALAVAAKVPFRIAAIGFEIAGIIKTNPLSRRVGYVVADGGYRYIPTTQWS